MLKAAADAGLQVNWYTYYAGGTGGPTSVKQTGLNHRVFAIQEGSANVDHAASQATEKAFREKFGVSIFYPRAFNQMRMLAAAINKANSTDPTKIALALEDMKVDVFNGGEGFMRKDDHQFFQPMYIVISRRAWPQGALRRGKDRLGLAHHRRLDAKDTVLPTSCKMNRPS